MHTFRLLLLLILPLFVINAWAQDKPSRIEMIVIQWPDAPTLEPKINAVVEQALFEINQARHNVLEPTLPEPLDTLEPLADAMSEDLTKNLILEGTFALEAEGTKTTLWIDQEQGDMHLYGPIHIEKKKYFELTADLMLEGKEDHKVLHLRKKTRRGQTNYVENMPLGMVFYIG